MISVTYLPNHTKFSSHARKFCSSFLPSVDKPSKPHGVTENTHSTLFNPFKFFKSNPRPGICNLRNTKTIHAYLLTSEILHSDIFLTNWLLTWYSKSTAMDHALRLFEEITNPNFVSWNTMISGYKLNLLFEGSWKMFCRMHSSNFPPNQFTLGSVLSACNDFEHPIFGNIICSLAIKNGLFFDAYVQSVMIDFFAKINCFQDALAVFEEVSCDNLVCWNSIISGAVRNGENWTAFDIFRQMWRWPLLPNSFTFSSILTACASLGESKMGRGVHGWVIKSGSEDSFVETSTVSFYTKCGEIDDAVKQFSLMSIRTVVSWTALISGFIQIDDSISALHFFNEMKKTNVEINSYTLTSVLAAAAKPSMQIEAAELHSWTLKTGFLMNQKVCASLINTYSKIGNIGLCEKAFVDMKCSLTDHMVCASMISALAQSEFPERAVIFFAGMIHEGLRPDQFCQSSVLSVIDCLFVGKQIHCYNIKTHLVFDVAVASSLLFMYSKCGSLEESYLVFKQIPEKDNASWSTMIAGFAEHGYADKAVDLFRDMLSNGRKPDGATFKALLMACSASSCLRKGKEVHAQTVRDGSSSDLLIGNAILNMYSKCGASKLARNVFDTMLQKNRVSSTSLASGYAQNGQIDEAVSVFRDCLKADSSWFDSFTLSSLIESVSVTNQSLIGIQLHGFIEKLGLTSQVSIGSSLVMMYSKRGSMNDCCTIFHQIKNPDLICWTTMITCYAYHGKGIDALTLYEAMRSKGFMPDSITFMGVLSACSHSGLVEEGYFHLNSMSKDYGIDPSLSHYTCMVDLLGRAGKLEEARRLIEEMPMEPNALIWRSLLSACRVHGNAAMAKVAAEKVMEIEPSDSGAYVSLSNVCADVGQWDEVWKIRNQMNVKEPGWSSV